MGLISSLLVVPALAALILALIPLGPRASRCVGNTAALVILSISVCLLWNFQIGSADFQFVERAPWIAELGINYEVGIDGISLFLVFLTALSAAVVIINAKDHERLRGFLSLFLFLELSLLGVFVTLDLILFYVFFELMLVPSYLLINGWGGPGRARAAIRFVLYTALGSVLMLSSIIYLGWLNVDQVGDPSFSIIDLSQSLRLEPRIEGLLFLGFFIAFAIKTPLVPLHSWLPSTYGEAPYGLTAFLSAVMAKAGLYGFIRFVWTLFPGAVSTGLSATFTNLFNTSSENYDFTSVFLWILVFGVIYTALIAWVQRDAKKILAYSSVSHLGICAIGVLICSTLSLTAAVFFMLAHGIVSLGLFLTLEAITIRTHSSQLVELGGLAGKLPKLSVFFFLFLLGSIALPLTGNFIAEFSVLLASFSKYPIQTAIAGISVILGAVYMLTLFRRAIFSKSEKNISDKDLKFSELVVLAPLAALVFIIGIFPQPILRRIEPSAQRLEGFVFDAINSKVDSGVASPEDFSNTPNFQNEGEGSAGLVVPSALSNSETDKLFINLSSASKEQI